LHNTAATVENKISAVDYTEASDVVLETMVLISRRLEDKNESLGLGLGS